MIPCIFFLFEFIYLCVVATVSERKKMEIDFKMSKNRFVISLQNLGWDKKKLIHKAFQVFSHDLNYIFITQLGDRQRKLYS